LSPGDASAGGSWWTPEVVLRDQGPELAARIWRLKGPGGPGPWLSISSAPLGGGLGLRSWIFNAQVPSNYICDDPVSDLSELARRWDLQGDGVGLLTAVNVRTASVMQAEGIRVDATVGVRLPQWAAAPDEVVHSVGTINIVAFLPVPLEPAALVNAVATVTEAKSQAMWEAGLSGTGTATDAVCLLCPPDGKAEPYGGPRSLWGARLARAVHAAVLTGCHEATGTNEAGT
jgi:adenosylcobinamide hydrolase